MIDTDMARGYETAVLHCAIWDRRGLNTVMAHVTAEDFGYTPNRIIFEAIRDVGKSDMLLVLNHLADAGRLDEVGGVRPVHNILDNMAIVPSFVNDYIKGLQEASRQRRQQHLGQKMARGEDVDWSELDKLMDTGGGQEVLRPDDVDMQSLYEDPNPPRGRSTGWETVDRHYRPGDGKLSVVHGIPGHGKSAFMDALSVNLAREHGFRIAFCSPEKMASGEDGKPSPSRHIADLISVWSGWPFFEGPRPRMDQGTFHHFWEKVNDHFTWILPEMGATSPRRVLHLASRLDIEGLIIDPWNELEHDDKPEHMAMTDYIGQSLSFIRRWAMEHSVHVWVVAHPTKLYDGGASEPVPQAKHIYGSSHWQNKADAILAIWRDRSDEAITQGRDTTAQIHVQKIRDRPWEGTEGMVELAFQPTSKQFKEMTKS